MGVHLLEHSEKDSEVSAPQRRSLGHPQKREMELKVRELAIVWFEELQSQKLCPLESGAYA